jgi:hypothetical protein
MNETDKILKTLKARPQIRAPIATDMFVPNHSGDHSAGTVKETPTEDFDIVNKKYVDDSHLKNIKILTDEIKITLYANDDIIQLTTTIIAGTLEMSYDITLPVDGHAFLIRIKSTNIQTFDWDGIFRGGTLALPTATTGGGKTDYLAFIYNHDDNKFDFTGKVVNL